MVNRALIRKLEDDPDIEAMFATATGLYVGMDTRGIRTGVETGQPGEHDDHGDCRRLDEDVSGGGAGRQPGLCREPHEQHDLGLRRRR